MPLCDERFTCAAKWYEIDCRHISEVFSMGKGYEGDGNFNREPSSNEDSSQRLRDDAAGRSTTATERAPEPPRPVEAPRAPEAPRQTEAASSGNGSSDRAMSPSEKSAQSKLDGENLAEKLSLKPAESAMLRNIESAILKGDSSAVQNLLRQHHDNPEALKPMMDVLVKDLAAAGIRANYEVNVALTDEVDSKGEKTGIFDMSTAKTPEDWMKKDSTFACFYTNPKSTGFANHEIPLPNRSPESTDLPLDLGLKQIGVKAATNLLETRR